MKKVFMIDTEEVKPALIKRKYEFIIFAEDMDDAIKKVLKYKDDEDAIIKAELLCVVEEDEDLKEHLIE